MIVNSPSSLHSVSVAAAIINGDRVLTIRRRDNGKWEPPGGVLELDETIEDGLRREVREETGLEIEIERLSGVYKNMTRGIVALVFRCSVVSGEPRTTDETAEFAWLGGEEVAQRCTEAFGVRLIDALESSDPIIRSHDGTSLSPGDYVGPI